MPGLRVGDTRAHPKRADDRCDRGIPGWDLELTQGCLCEWDFSFESCLRAVMRAWALMPLSSAAACTDATALPAPWQGDSPEAQGREWHHAQKVPGESSGRTAKQLAHETTRLRTIRVGSSVVASAKSPAGSCHSRGRNHQQAPPSSRGTRATCAPPHVTSS